MIVGEVSVVVRPNFAGFAAAMVAETDRAAIAAGNASGVSYAAAFRRSSGSLAGGLKTSFAGGTAVAGEAGLAAGRAYGAGATAGARQTTAFAPAISRGAAAAGAVAHREGGAAGRLFGTAFGKSAVPLAAAVVGAASVKMAGDFQQDTNVLVTAAKESVANLPIVRKGILDTAVETGTAINLVTDATYDAEKAGYRGAKANEVVRASAQAAREENANLKTVVSGVTTVMNSYGGDAIKTANALKTGAATAKASFETYTAGLGNFVSRAKAAKLALPDVLSVYSSVTQTGITPQRASQNIGQTIQNLTRLQTPQLNEFGALGIDPKDFQAKLGERGLSGSLNYLSDTVLHKLGPAGTVLLDVFNKSQTAAQAADLELQNLPPDAKAIATEFRDGQISLTAATKGFKGLTGVQSQLGLQFLGTYKNAHGFQQVIKNGGPQTQPYLDAMRRLLGGQQAVTVALGVSGDAFAATQERTKSIAESYNNASKNVEGWESTQGLFNKQFASFRESVKRAAIEIGTEMLPTLTKFFGFFSSHPGFAKGAIEGLLALGGAIVVGKIAGLITTLGRLATSIRGVGRASTVAAAETRAAGLTSAVGTGAAGAGAAGAAGSVGAGAAGAAGAAGLASRLRTGIAGSALTRIAIPIGLTIVGLDAAKTAKSVIDDLRRGHFQDAVQKGLSSMLAKGMTFGLNESLKDLAKGDPAKALFDVPGVKKATDLVNGGPLKGSIDPGTLADFKSDQARDAAKVLEILGGNARATALNMGELSRSYHLNLDQADLLYQTNTKYLGQLQDFPGKLSRSSDSLKGNSDGAVQNRNAIRDMVEADHEHAVAVFQQTGNLQDANSTFRAGIGEIANNAAALGLNKQEVINYVAQVLGIPPQKITEILAPGLLANETAVQGYLQWLNSIPANVQTTVTTYYQSIGTPHEDTLASAAVGYGGPTTFDGSGRAKRDGGLVGRADGGLIKGPGTPTSDSILGVDRRTGRATAWVSTDEFVVNAKSTAAHLPLLEYLNGGADASTHLAKGGKPAEPLLPGTLTTATQAFKDALRKLAAEANAIAKIGVTGVLKTTTTDIKAGQKAIADAVKQGNGPLQKQLEAQLKTAQGKLYGTGLAAVRDKVVTPQEALAVKVAASGVEALTKRLEKLNTVNQQVKDSISSFIQAQQDYRNGLRDTLTSGNTLTDALTLSGSARDVRASLGEKLATLRAFTKKIVALKKAGYSDVVVREIAQDGLDNGVLYADELLRGSKGDVTGINQAYADLQNAQSKSSAAISLLTQPNAPGITSRAAQAEINQAIYTKGVNTDRAAARAEYDQRAGVTVIQNNSYNGVDLKTAQAVTARDLALALKGAGVAGG